MTAPSPDVFPHDHHNETLVANVHPPDWVNPEPTGRYNLVVIGAGTAGLVTAAGAAGLGAKDLQPDPPDALCEEGAGRLAEVAAKIACDFNQAMGMPVTFSGLSV